LENKRATSSISSNASNILIVITAFVEDLREKPLLETSTSALPTTTQYRFWISASPYSYFYLSEIPPCASWLFGTGVLILDMEVLQDLTEKSDDTDTSTPTAEIWTAWNGVD
jgi:hypothetical protein